MEKLEKKVLFGLSIVLCGLAVTMAIAQTIMMNGFHPVIFAFWAMAGFSIFFVKHTKNEMKNGRNGSK